MGVERAGQEELPGVSFALCISEDISGLGMNYLFMYLFILKSKPYLCMLLLDVVLVFNVRLFLLSFWCERSNAMQGGIA